MEPNPYDGIIAAGGPTPAEYAKGPNWKYCAAIYKKYVGEKPQTPTQVVKKGGKIIDNYESMFMFGWDD